MASCMPSQYTFVHASAATDSLTCTATDSASRLASQTPREQEVSPSPVANDIPDDPDEVTASLRRR